RHLAQVPRNRLRLAALLRAETGVRPRRIDQRDDRTAELLRLEHEPQRLPVSLRMRHAEVAAQVLLHVAALLMAHHHHGPPVEPRPPAYDRFVIAVVAVAVQLDEVGERAIDVVERERPLRVTRELHALHRRQVAVRFLAQTTRLLLQQPHFVRHVETMLRGDFLELTDLLLESRQITIMTVLSAQALPSSGAYQPDAIAAEQLPQIVQ